MSIPYFLPDKSMGSYFQDVLNEYPVSPYLDTKLSLMKWMHFIHNHINIYTNKQKISFKEAQKHFEAHTIPIPKSKGWLYRYQDTSITIGVIGTLIILSYLLYKRSSCVMV
jgi:hypothetical protein